MSSPRNLAAPSHPPHRPRPALPDRTAPACARWHRHWRCSPPHRRSRHPRPRYTQEWNDDGTPKTTATRFHLVEDGDQITYRFSDTRLERWISLDPSKPRLQPIFTSAEVNNTLTLKSDTRLLIGGLTREELIDGQARKTTRYLIIERKTSPAPATKSAKP